MKIGRGFSPRRSPTPTNSTSRSASRKSARSPHGIRERTGALVLDAPAARLSVAEIEEYLRIRSRALL